MAAELEQKNGRRIDYRRDGALDWAALGLGALLLLDRLRTLLGLLLGLLAVRSPSRLAGQRCGRPDGRQCDCANDKPPLHAADVTTPSMNSK
jgi:hypothetical protein